MNYLLGTIIILVMVGGGIGMWPDDQDKVEVDDREFVSTDYGWQAYYGDSKLVLTMNPLDLNVSLANVDLGFLSRLSKVYLSINPYQDYRNAVYDFQYNVNLPQVVYSCYEDSELCSEMVIKTCDDASSSVGVVVFKESEEDRISLENNCLTIEGKDLLKVTDKLILSYYENKQ